MFVAAAEGDGDLINGRGDAYCGMLNCSYNLGLRGLTGYIPEYPVGTAEELADKMAEFVPIARAIIGIKNLKIITFGPRPQDFFACNAPINGLYQLGVEIEENSELDLLVSYKEHAGDARIPDVCADMAKEMGEGKYYPDMLERMAQFELTLLDWAENHKGSRQYVAFADKCWPAFPSQFGFEPCYVNSRLATRGIPVACEVDIYGALSEYIGMCISGDTVTLLDINNSVPASMYEAQIKGKFDYDYKLNDTFMGFHCGNTPSCKLCADRAVKYQLIQHRLLEPAGSDPDFTAVPWKATSPPAKSPSTACRALLTASSAATWQRARSCLCPPAPSAASACSPSPRWAVSTATCWWRSAIPTTAPWPLAITARPSSSCSSCWASRTSASTSPRACSTRPRTPSPKKENAIQKGGTPGGMPLFLLLLGLLPPQTESGLAKAKPLFLARFRLDLLRPQGHHRVFLGGAAGGDDAREQGQGGADEHQHQGRGQGQEGA